MLPAIFRPKLGVASSAKTGNKKMAALKSATLVLISALLATPALGDDIFCESNYGEETLDGDLMVAAPCTLNGTKVKGNVTLFSGGSLVADGATIDGNIKARTADFIELKKTEVDGNVDLRDMVGDVSIVSDSEIDGKMVVKDSRSRLEFRDNYVDGKLEVANNSGVITIVENVIDGDLKCKDNTPAPNGGSNQVSGKKEGQCVVLEAVSSPEEPENDGATGTEEPENDGATGTEEPENDGATGTTDGSDAPPFEVNSGTGGGGSMGPLVIAVLLIVHLARSRRRPIR